MAEQSIRVSARGEFGQLQRGLKSLQSDLKGVVGEIDRGARKGGFFDESNVRALDIFRRRFKDSMGELGKEFKKQNDLIDDLYKKMEKASRSDREEIQKRITAREKELDVIRKQMYEMERLYNVRNKEAGGFGSSPSKPVGGSSGSGGGLVQGALSAGGGILSKVLGAGRFALGLAGIGGITSMVAEAYQQAYQREVASLDVAQRLRGNGFSGSNTSIYDQVSEVGRRDRMGYSQMDSWQLQDAYSQRAGTLGADGQYALQRFSRGYGLDATQTGATVAGVKSLGGVSNPKEFADMIAGSVAKSGMIPRIMEVMDTHTGLLTQLNTTFKDGSSKNLLALQTTLDTIGNKNGMPGLTGSQGARVISGLGGIYAPSDDKWKWMGVEALQKYNPQKYGKMGLYDLETKFEDGLMNKDNLPAMTNLLRQKSGGNETIFKRMLQQWLTDGGFAASKSQVNELYTGTHGMTDLSNADKYLNPIDSGAKYASERQSEKGQGILDTEARYTKALEGIGSQFVDAINSLKGDVTNILEWLNKNTPDDWGQKIYDWIKGHWVELATAAGILSVANALTTLATVLGVKKALDGVFGKKGGGGGGGVPDVPVGGGKGRNVPKPAAGDTGKPSGWLKNAKEVAGNTVDDVKEYGGKAAGWFSRLPKWAQWGGRALGGAGTVMTADALTKPIDNAFDWLFGHKQGQTKTGGGFFSNPLGNGAWEDTRDPFWKRMGGSGSADDTSQKLVEFATKGQLSIDGLSTFGQQKLQALADAGLLKLEDMKNGSTTTLSGFTQTGQDALLKLQQDGLIAIGGMQSGGLTKLTSLSEEGTKRLEELKAGGLINIGDFQTDGKKRITWLSEEGAKRLFELQENGSGSLVGMSKDSAAKMGEIRNKHYDGMDIIMMEHKGIKDVIKGIWDSFTTWLKEHIPFFGRGDSSIGNNKFGGQYSDLINEAGSKYGVDPLLIASVVRKESKFDPNATSPSGAMGLMQLMPGTAAGLGVKNPYDARENVMGGTQHLARLIKKYNGNIEYALYAYNAGEGNVDKWIESGQMGNIPYGETKSYAPSVMGYYNDYKKQFGSQGGGGNFFAGWQNRITSKFGDTDGRSKPHGGLDIGGSQGQSLQALAGGRISFINMDDGSRYDSDQQANTRGGGTEVGVRMANGKTYFYSHLSGVDPGILSRYMNGEQVDVNAGDMIGNLGGDPNAPGSGYSTTGSHLHLGYMDANGNLQNPEDLLNSMNRGDSDIGRMSAGGISTVNVNITGEGAPMLNSMTLTALEAMVRKVLAEVESRKLSMNPTTRTVG